MDFKIIHIKPCGRQLQDQEPIKRQAQIGLIRPQNPKAVIVFYKNVMKLQTQGMVFFGPKDLNMFDLGAIAITDAAKGLGKRGG